MTEYQLPETSATLAFGGSEWESEWISSEDAYSAEQMQQAYAAGREAMRQECVKVCEKWHDSLASEPEMLEIAEEIRNLK